MLICPGYALSQAGKTELVGEVRDQNGALIPSARITLIVVATQQAFSETTKDGNYLITNLKPGTYNLAVEADGFKRSVQEGIRLATGERIRVATVLDPGVVSELVPSSQQSTAQFFNTAAFQAGPQFTIGNSSRNPVRGPGYRNADIAVIKRVAFGETRNVEFRTEFFNLTNTRH